MNTLTEIIQHVEANNPAPGKCLISFSGGKDAWCCELALREHMDTTLYAYYLVPGLEVVDEYLDYCERKAGKKIYRLPSPRIYARLNEMHYQPPERVGVIDAACLPKIDFDTISRVAEEASGLPENMWTAIGVRAADSIARAGAIKAHGCWSDKRRIFYPVWDWKKSDVLDALKRNDVKLSKEYLAFGRNMDGLFLLYALGLKKHFPRDYAKVLEFFPFVELEIFRYEKALEMYGGISNLPKEVPVPGEKEPIKSKFGFCKRAPEPEKKKDKYSTLNSESKKVAAKMQAMVFPDFWVSVYFPDKSRFQVVFEDADQRDFLLRKLKLFGHGDKYLDGRYVAAKLGINGFPSYPMMQKAPKIPNPLSNTVATIDPVQDCYAEFRALLAAMPRPVEIIGSMAEKFLTKSGWVHTGGNCWGHDVANALGVELPQTTYYYRPEARPDAKLNALVG